LACKVGDFGISRLFEASGGTADGMQHVEITKLVPQTLQRGGTGAHAQSPGHRRTPSAAASLAKKLGLASSSHPADDRDGSVELEQTSNVGTARYMAPEVFNRGDGANARYGVKADIFSVGMVFYFVFEGQVPRVPGGHKPDGHFAALAQGPRPVYLKTKLAQQRIIDLCLKDCPRERLSAVELVQLLKPLALPQGGGCGLCGGVSAAAQQQRASAALSAQVTLAKVESRLGRSGSSRDNSTTRSLRSNGSNDLRRDVNADAVAKLAQDCLPPPPGGYGAVQPVLRAPVGDFGSINGLGSSLDVPKSPSGSPGRLLPASFEFNSTEGSESFRL
jgi:serine/threonine protein kinase